LKMRLTGYRQADRVRGCVCAWTKAMQPNGWKPVRKHVVMNPHIQLRKEESEAIKNSDFKTHRWVVERIHSLTNRFRRILRFVRKRSKTTRRCCILHAASLSGIKSYWDRLLVCHYINRIPRRGTCGTPHLNVTLLIQAPHNITIH